MDKIKIVIGIDQSYKNTGITAIQESDIVLFARSEKFEGCENNTEKRNRICLFLDRKLSNLKKISDDIIVIIERISMRAEKGGFSKNYVQATTAMISAIIDTCYLFNIPVYSVDTRSWKFQIVGTTSPKKNRYGIPPEKYPAIEYLRDSGRLKYICEENVGKRRNGVVMVKERHTGRTKEVYVNDNIADSFCIALYGFLPEEKQKLQLERF